MVKMVLSQEVSFAGGEQLWIVPRLGCVQVGCHVGEMSTKQWMYQIGCYPTLGLIIHSNVGMRCRDQKKL